VTMQSQGPSGPPDFQSAANRRQKARAAGMHPDYWYAVEQDRNVKRGQVVEVTFWKRSIALFRGEDGALRAIDNRCAHRQLKLTLGAVQGNQLVCPYHGWCYDGRGQVVDIPHELFGRPMPNLRVRSYPVKVRYGLVFIFPGDPALAEKRTIPDIPEIEGPDAWPCIPLDATWKAHHSMIIDNVCDFTHAHLHRKYKPFVNSRLTRYEAVGDSVLVSYDTQVGMGPLTQHMFDRKEVNMSAMELGYQYPYQWSNTDGKIKHWLFVLPIDERTTRAFFLFHFTGVKLPFLPVNIPRRVLRYVLRAANFFQIEPLLREDGVAVEAEQLGYEQHYDEPVAELNPAVNLFQQLTIRKWEEYLASADDGRSRVQLRT